MDRPHTEACRPLARKTRGYLAMPTPLRVR